MSQRVSPYDVRFYEGLCRKTASMYVGLIEEDYEDVLSILRIKCWRALQAYDPVRAQGVPVERYVFSCVRNQVKDLLKRKRRNELYLEDVSRVGDIEATDAFECRYLAVDDDLAAEVEPERPSLSGFTSLELRVMALRYADYSERELARHLGLPQAEVRATVVAIQQKLRAGVGELRSLAA